MTSAIWALAYDISDDDRHQYLDWFHQIHIPEKLARPGYRWAAHYEGPHYDQAANAAGTYSYIALFGGSSTRVFLDPSPAQLKTKQDDLTRKMMGLRHNPFATILAHEWSLGGSSAALADIAPAIDPVQADRLDFLAIDAGGMDEAVGAWATQQLGPRLHQSELARPQTAAITHKLISVTGGPAHILLHATSMTGTANDVASNAIFDLDEPVLAERPETASLRHLTGTRVWPA